MSSASYIFTFPFKHRKYIGNALFGITLYHESGYVPKINTTHFAYFSVFPTNICKITLATATTKNIL